MRLLYFALETEVMSDCSISTNLVLLISGFGMCLSMISIVIKMYSDGIVPEDRFRKLE